MKFLPDLKTVISFGNLSITWYALFILSGAVLAYYLIEKRFLKMGYDKKIIEDFAFYLLPIVLVGARLWYVIFEWHQYASNPVRILFVNEGGLAIHGGLLAGIIFGVFYFRKHRIHILRMADLIFPFVMLAQAIGRWGNFMNQEAYGGIVSESYYNLFPKFIKEVMYIDGAYRQPTFLFESIGNLVGFGLIYFGLRKVGRRKYGDLFFGYLAYYGVIRFFIEGLRTDSLMIMGLRTAQLTSIVFVVVGVVGLLWKDKTKPIIGFDLDGTLLNSEPLIMSSFKHTFKTLNPSLEISEAEYRSFLGFTLDTTFKKYVGEDYQKYIDTYRKHNLEHHDEMVKLYDGAKELLEKLKSEGYTIAIISSKKKDLVLRALQLFNVDQYCDTIVGYEDVANHKPDKEPLKTACNLLNKGHDHFVYVGDSVQDMRACKNLGGFSIAVLFDEIRKQDLLNEKADAYVNHLNEIGEILKEERVWQNSTI